MTFRRFEIRNRVSSSFSLSVVLRSNLPMGPSWEGRYRPSAPTAAADLPLSVANARIVASLGRILDNVLQRSVIRRAVTSGGDTSGHGLGQMGVYALDALSPTLPGAQICTAYSDGFHDGLQIALKGGRWGMQTFSGMSALEAVRAEAT